MENDVELEPRMAALSITWEEKWERTVEIEILDPSLTVEKICDGLADRSYEVQIGGTICGIRERVTGDIVADIVDHSEHVIDGSGMEYSPVKS